MNRLITPFVGTHPSDLQVGRLSRAATWPWRSRGAGQTGNALRRFRIPVNSVLGLSREGRNQRFRLFLLGEGK
jgi:hypothetical protein